MNKDSIETVAIIVLFTVCTLAGFFIGLTVADSFYKGKLQHGELKWTNRS